MKLPVACLACNRGNQKSIVPCIFYDSDKSFVDLCSSADNLMCISEELDQADLDES